VLSTDYVALKLAGAIGSNGEWRPRDFRKSSEPLFLVGCLVLRKATNASEVCRDGERRALARGGEHPLAINSLSRQIRILRGVQLDPVSGLIRDGIRKEAGWRRLEL